MVRTTEEAAELAERTFTCVAGSCQTWTRTIFDAHAVGDVDADGDPDAEDGWKSEPAATRHTDRSCPRGFPGAFFGGSHDNGHRVVGLGGGKFRSTDMSDDGTYSPGHVGTVTIDQIERAMGVTWVGWSETISGLPIPKQESTRHLMPPRETRGPKIDQAMRLLRQAKGEGLRREIIDACLAALEKIPPIDS